MLTEMKENPPQAMSEDPCTPILAKDMPLLDKVQLKAELSDIYNTQSITEVVFLAMQDMMPKETIHDVEAELQALSSLRVMNLESS